MAMPCCIIYSEDTHSVCNNRETYCEHTRLIYNLNKNNTKK